MEMIPGLVADANLSTKQFTAVKLSTTSGKVSAFASATDIPVGILDNKPDADNRAASVVPAGNLTKARYGGTVTAGDLLMAASDGELVKHTSGTDVTQWVIAQCIRSGVDQDVQQVMVIGPYKGSAS